MSKFKFKRVILSVMVSLVAIVLSCAIYFKTDSKKSFNTNLDNTVALSILDNNTDSLTSAEAQTEILISDDIRGRVEGSGKFAVGKTVTIKAIAKEGCVFKGWQVWNGSEFINWYDEDGWITDDIYSFVVESDIKLRAFFDYIPYSVNTNFDDFLSEEGDFSYEFDSTRFTNDVTAEYPLAVIASSNYKRTATKFYYNDIATINYKAKSENIKQLSANDFNVSSNVSKKLAVLHIDTDGNLIGEEKDGQFTAKNEKFDTSKYQHYENYYYIVLTQKYVGKEADKPAEYLISAYEKFVTTNICLKCKVQDNIQFDYNVQRLNTVKIVAYEWFSNESENPINIDKVSELIDFEYGYFSKLENTTITLKDLDKHDVEVSCLQYAVEENSNFKFNFTSNDLFRFKRSNATRYSEETSLNGYFYPELIEDDDFYITVSFERIKYNLTFKEYFINGTDFTELSADEYIYNIQNLRLYPEETILLDLDEDGGISLQLPSRLDAVTLNKNTNIFGYELKAVVVDFANVESGEIVLETGINAEPSDVEVKIVYEKISYTLSLEVVNNQILENNAKINAGEIAGEIQDPIDSYLASKLTLAGSFISNNSINIVRGDLINLSSDIKNGFSIIGWKIKGATENLSNLSFDFIPSSNETRTLSYQLIVDYIYYDTTFNLDGIITSEPVENVDGTKTITNRYRANMDSVVVDYLTFDSSTNLLTIFGTKYYIESTLDETDQETTILTDSVKFKEELQATKATIINQAGEVGLKKYSTSFGSVFVNFNGDKFEKITINNVEFNFDESDSKFKTTKIKRLDIAIGGVKSADKITIEADDTFETVEFTYSFTNLTCDDLILMRSQSADTNQYKIRYYLYGNTATESYNINYFKDDDSVEGKYYSYIYKSAHGETITAVYVDLAQDITIKINNQNAFNLLDNLTRSISGEGSSTETTDDEPSIKITANPGMVIRLSFNKNDIVKGYKFNIFNLTTFSGSLQPMTKFEDGNIIYVEFSMAVDYYNAVITLDFSAIDYIVTFNFATENDDNSAHIDFNINGNVNTHTPSSNLINASFSINIEDVTKIAYNVSVHSSSGYYISNVYVGTDAETNIIDALLGVYSEQTNSTILFDLDNFERFILNLADSENKVTINVVESERLYDISVLYHVIDDSSLSYLSSGAKAELKDVTNSDEIISTGSATLVEDNIKLIFTEIKYGAELKITINDIEVPGLYFKGWDDANSVNKEKIFTITDNIEFNAYFKLIEYTITYKFIAGETGEEATERGSVISTIAGVETSSMRINDKVSFIVTSNTGYRYNMCYYLQGETKLTNNINIIDKDTHEYELTFDPTSMPGFSKDSQVNGADLYRTLTIYLEFSVKVYQINCETTGSKGDTGLAVEDWADYVVEGITHSVQGGTNYYATNTELTIKFETNLNGILLNNIKFNKGKTYEFSNVQVGFETESNVANQYMTLSYFYDNTTSSFKGEFKFILSVHLLAELKESDDNFILKFAFKVKKYTFEFKGSGYQGNFGLEFAGVYGMSGTSATDMAISVTKNYGTLITFTANSSGASDNFNDKYKVSNVTLTCDGKKIIIYDYSSTESPTTIRVITKQTLTVEDIGEIAFWEYVALTNTTITIDVCYEAKISLDNFTFDTENKVWRKTVQYNGYSQQIDADVVYDKSYFTGALVVKYNGVRGNESIPKNVGSYQITIEVNGYFFKDKVELVITKAPLSLTYNGGNIAKIYDGTNVLTGDNKASLINSLRINGLLASDSLRFVTNSVSAIYSDRVVGTGYNISLFNLSIVGEVLSNYEFSNNISEMLIEGIGVINKKAINLTMTDYFEFGNMVYKEGFDYVLVNKKADANITSTTLEEDYHKIFPIGRIQIQGANTEDTSDDVYDDVYIDKTLLEYVLEDYSIGYNKQIHIKLIKALAGADKSNYEIVDKYYSINIHPYEVVCEVESKGVFKIIDLDEKCIIPIEISPKDGLKVSITESTSSGYNDLFSIIERLVGRDERVYGFLEFSLVAKSSNSVSTNSLAGAYMVFEPFKDVSNIYMISDNQAIKIEHNSSKNAVNFKISSSQTDLFAIVLDRTYLPIWLIILIVVIILLFIILIVILFIVFKKKRKQKYAEHDKIR